MKFLLFISLITWILSPVTLATASTTPFPIPSDSTDNQVGSVKGIVLDAYQKTPLPGVHVVLMNHRTGTITSEAGQFTLESIPFGPQELEISMIGFQTLRLPFRVDAENPKPILQVELTENTLLMEEVVVRPDRKPIARQEPYSVHTLDAQDLQTRTQLGEDVFRSIAQVPGMASNDFSSKFTIRGSDHHEMLVQLDGQELYEPFHIKDVGGGVLGIVDSDLISELALYPGGAPASFDNRLGGVLDMQTSGAAERTRKTMVGISLTNARFMSQGALAGGKADWLVLGRRGYIDLMLNFTNQDSNFSPRYYDVFGQFRYHLSSSHRLTFNVLQSGDGLHYVETKDPEDKAKSAYYSSYAWANWRALWSNRLFSTTMLSGASLNSSRNGVDMRMSNGQLVFRAADYRNMDMVTLKQDWTLQSGDDTATTWGFSMKYGQAVYDYYNIERYENDDIDTPFGAQYIQTRADLTPGGTHFGGYLQQQLPIGEKLRMDAGLRFDAVSWTGDRYVSPRISMAYALTSHTRLTGSMGRFFQSQQLHQLDVQDGDSEFHAAEIADQIVLGLSQEINSSLLLKVEAYSKRKDNLRTRYTSLFGDVTSLFPEKGAGRVAVPYSVGRARGIEFSAQKPIHKGFGWWANYTLSSAEDQVDGQWIAKTFDQRHAVNLNIQFETKRNWGGNIGWTYHSGWRYTDLSLELVRPAGGEAFYRMHFGEMNALQLPAYHRLDARLHRNFNFRKSTLSTYLEVRNLYNRHNVRIFDYEPANQPDGTVLLTPKPQSWLPMIPAFGIELVL